MANEGKLYGVYGGAFDPVHAAHVEMARAAQTFACLDEVLFIPAAAPPHRPPPVASGAQRLAMLHLALADLPGCRPCACELREGLRWTIDTLRFLRRSRPGDQPCLLCGLDNVLQLPDWRDWRALLELAHLIVLPRGGARYPQPLPDWWREKQSDAPLPSAPDMRIVRLDHPPMTLSSSDIRRRIKADEPVGDDLGPAVAGFIRRHHLYRA